MSRPSRRWTYSHQKMDLKPSSVMSWLRSRNSGVSWYFSNVSAHWASFRGGSAPTSGCHSTMESPEWVSRVAPPTTTMAKTSAQQARSHAATGSRLPGASEAGAAGAPIAVAFTGSM